MNLKEKILLAKSQVGKRASDYGFNTEWCALFINWLFPELKFEGEQKSRCTKQVEYFKNKGMYSTNRSLIEVGSIVYYDWNPSGNDGVDHVGVVVAVDRNSGTITVIEGNAGDGYSYRDRKVISRTIASLNGCISGFARLQYDAVNVIPNDTNLSVEMVNTYDIRVKVLQTFLNNVTGSSLMCDGYYGNKTKAEVVRYQKENKLEVDGIAGKETLTHISKKFFNIS